MSDEIKVRDCRRPGHFWADNELIDVHGKAIGIDGLAVYMALSRVARNDTGECAITLRQISGMIGCSPQTAMRAINKLVKSGLVLIESKGSVVNRQPSVYTLLQIPKRSVPIGNNENRSSGTEPVPSLVPIGNTYKTINNTKEEYLNTGTSSEGFSLEPENSNGKPRKHRKVSKVELPAWLPMEEWEGWLDMRVKMRKPATEIAQIDAIGKLTGFYLQKENIREIMRKAIGKNWLTFWSLNGEGSYNAPLSLQNGSGKPKHLLDGMPGPEELAAQRLKENARIPRMPDEKFL